MNNDTKKDNFAEGFTQIPHVLENTLPCLKLTLREYKLVLIIIRLTYGCQKRWAHLDYNDLEIGNVKPPHAGKVFRGLLNKNLVVKNNTSEKEYRINEEYIKQLSKREYKLNLEKYQNLVGENLYIRSSGLDSKASVARIGKARLLKREYANSLKGNVQRLPKRELSDSERDEITPPKDKGIQKDNDNCINTISPFFFIPKTTLQEAAYNVWKMLEPHKTGSLGFYLSMAKRGLPEHEFYRLGEAIKNDTTARNKGATFVKLSQAIIKRYEQK